jgi:hypothetical protein
MVIQFMPKRSAWQVPVGAALRPADGMKTSTIFHKSPEFHRVPDIIYDLIWMYKSGGPPAREMLPWAPKSA